MNKQAKEQMYRYYKEVLSSEAGMRVLGGIFYQCGLMSAQPMGEFQQGRRSVAVQIANTIYNVNPYGVADCLTAYDDFMKEYVKDERRDETEPYKYSE